MSFAKLRAERREKKVHEEKEEKMKLNPNSTINVVLCELDVLLAQLSLVRLEERKI